MKWYLKNYQESVVILALISLAIIVGFVGSSVTILNASQEAQFPVISKAAQPAVLSSGTISGVNYAVNEINTSKEYRSYQAKGNFVIIHLTIQNSGLVPAETTQSFFRLIDNQGTQYNTATEATSCYSLERNSKMWSAKIEPGAAAEGYLVFDVPEGPLDFKLMISPSNLSSSTYILLKVKNN